MVKKDCKLYVVYTLRALPCMRDRLSSGEMAKRLGENIRRLRNEREIGKELRTPLVAGVFPTESPRRRGQPARGASLPLELAKNLSAARPTEVLGIGGASGRRGLSVDGSQAGAPFEEAAGPRRATFAA